MKTKISSRLDTKKFYEQLEKLAPLIKEDFKIQVYHEGAKQEEINVIFAAPNPEGLMSGDSPKLSKYTIIGLSMLEGFNFMTSVPDGEVSEIIFVYKK